MSKKAWEPNQIDELFRDNLVRIMKERGIIQSDLARISGIKQSRVNAFCRLKRGIGAYSLLKLCRALQITPSEFLQEPIPSANPSCPHKYETPLICDRYHKLSEESKAELLRYLEYLVWKDLR